MLKIEGKDVIKISVYNYEDKELIKSFKYEQGDDINKTLEMIYNFIYEAQKADIEMIGYKMHYYIELETSDMIYGDYILIKHRDGKYSFTTDKRDTSNYM